MANHLDTVGRPSNFAIVEDLIAYTRKLEQQLESAAATIAEGQQERERLSVRIAEMEREIVEQSRRSQAQAGEKAAVDALLAESVKLGEQARRRVHELGVEHSRLEARIQDLEHKRVEESRRALEIIQRHKQQSLEQARRIQNERERLIAERDAAVEARRRLQGEIHALLEKSRGDEEARDQALAGMDRLKLQNRELEGERLRLLAQLQRLEVSHLDLRRNRNQGEELARKSEDRVHGLEIQLAQAIHRARSSEETCRSLEMKCQRLEERVAQSQAELARERESQTFAREEFERMRRRLRNLELTRT